MNKVKIKIKSLEWFDAEFDYNHDLIEYIKNNIPVNYREYNPDTFEWHIHQFYLPDLLSYLDKKIIRYDVIVDDTIQPYFTKDDSLLNLVKVNTHFYNHQKEAIKFEMTHQNFIIGDDQGLGKTLELLAFATSLKKKGAKHCLIICGVAGNVWNWKEEIKLHTDEEAYIIGTDFNGNIGSGKDKYDSLHYPHKEFFYITNIETLRLLRKKVGRKYTYPIVDIINTLVAWGEISLIAVDECHKVKNPESQQGKALLELKCPRKAMLSGTLVMNNPLDLYTPLKWCGVINDNFWHFKQEFCRFGGYGGYEIIGYKNQETLRKLLSPIYIRRKKEDVLDLPEKIMIDESIQLDAQQRAGYSIIENNLQCDINKIMFSDNPLSLMLRLREYLDDPELVEMAQVTSPKFERLLELLDNIFDNSSSQVIIYSQWSRVTKKLKSLLENNYSVSYIDGDVSVENRMIEIEKFQSCKSKIIIGTIGALGTGFTLNKASNVIFVDEPWNMAIKNQAIDRAHRIGTKYPVNVHTLICKDTIDERIHQLIKQKGDIADDLLSTDNPKLTTEEIKYLCGL